LLCHDIRKPSDRAMRVCYNCAATAPRQWASVNSSGAGDAPRSSKAI
jgi:hypothetical protein